MGKGKNKNQQGRRELQIIQSNGRKLSIHHCVQYQTSDEFCMFLAKSSGHHKSMSVHQVIYSNQTFYLIFTSQMNWSLPENTKGQSEGVTTVRTPSTISLFGERNTNPTEMSAPMAKI